MTPSPAAASSADCGPGTLALATLLIAFVAAAFPEVVSGDHTFVYRDFGLQTYPAAMHFRRSFWLGELPLWNPYSFSGIPFLAQWSTGVLYPPSLLYLLLPPLWGLGVFSLAHVVFAGVAMYWLARAWVGDRGAAAVAGVVYACSGLMLSSLEWPAYLAVIAWAPLVILTTERAWREGGARIPQAAIVGALQMLGGVPELILLTWIALVVLFAGSVLLPGAAARRSGSGGVSIARVMSRFAAVVGLVAALAAAQLLPFLDLVALSDRSQGFGSNYWAMPAWGVANLLVPLFHTARSIQGVTYQHGQELLGSYYLGIGALALALLACRRAPGWRVFSLFGLAVVAFAMAMGSHGPLFDGAKMLVPQLGYLRYPVKFVFLTGLVVPLLAAFAVRHYARASALPLRGLRLELCLVAALLVAIAAVVLWGRAYPRPGESLRLLEWSGITRAALLCVLVAGVVALPRVAAGVPRRVALLVLLGVFAFDGLGHANLAPTAPVDVYAPQRARMTSVPRLGESRAMLSPQARKALLRSGRRNLRNSYLAKRRALLQNTNLLPAIPKVDGHFWLQLGETAAVHRRLYLEPPVPAGLADFLGVSQMIEIEDEALAWRTRSSAMPLATGGQLPIFGRGPADLAAPGFDPRRVVHLANEDRERVSVSRLSRVEIAPEQIGAHALEFSIDARDRALVVVAQSFHPAWVARVDGERVPVLRANHAFQAVEVPAGRHRLRLTYEDRVFRWGSVLSVAASIGCLAWMGLARRRPRTREGSR